MSNPKKNHELIRQNEQIVKKSQKHDANLQKNSTLYFQIGLIVCLLFTYGLFEMTFETSVNDFNDDLVILDPILEVPIENFKVYEEPKAEVKPEAVKKILLTDKVIEVDDDFKMEEFIEVITSEQNTTTEPAIDPGSINVLPPPEEDIHIAFIQKVPIYPGCEEAKNNEERKKCFSKKITKLIQRKFEGSDIASNYGLVGKQKIDVQFTIDKTGKVTDIKTRSPHPKLDEEAERVINIIPKMTPGKQNNKNVGVIYTLPIVFHAQ